MGEFETLITVFWSLFRAGIVVIAGFLMASLIGVFLRRFFHKAEVKEYFKNLGYGKVLEDIIVVAVKYLIYLVSILIALTQLGMGAFFIQLFIGIAVLVVAVVLIFSLRSFIKNAASGLYLLRTKIIKKGEMVKISGVEGKVLSVNLLTTTLSEKGKRVIVPNSLLTKEIIVKE